MNSCNSAPQAARLAESVVPFAIGMSDTIDDTDAINYTRRHPGTAANRVTLTPKLTPVLVHSDAWLCSSLRAAACVCGVGAMAPCLGGSHFKTAAFVHSATPPTGGYRIRFEISRRAAAGRFLR